VRAAVPGRVAGEVTPAPFVDRVVRIRRQARGVPAQREIAGRSLVDHQA